MPIYMRLGKLRGPHMKKSMPIGPFRTYCVPVNVGRLAAAFAPATRSRPRRWSPSASSRTRARRSRSSAAARSAWRSRCACTRSPVGAPRRSRRPAAQPSSSIELRRAGRGREQQALAVAGQRLEDPGAAHQAALHGGMLAIYRFGAHVPVPGIDTAPSRSSSRAARRRARLPRPVLGRRARASVAVFALGIMPYITASIIMQLLTVVIPKLEELQGGRAGPEEDHQVHPLADGRPGVRAVHRLHLPVQDQGALPNLNAVGALIVVTLTAGATAVMWLGELITARGIGNGMSILIFISIISRMPGGVRQVLRA